jgi:hypothetical protein
MRLEAPPLLVALGSAQIRACFPTESDSRSIRSLYAADVAPALKFMILTLWLERP